MLADFSMVGNQAGGAAEKTKKLKTPTIKGGGTTPPPVGKPMTKAELQRAAIVADNRRSATLNVNVKAGIGSNPAQVGREIVQAVKAYERSSGII
jgi:hypothetical protein